MLRWRWRGWDWGWCLLVLPWALALAAANAAHVASRPPPTIGCRLDVLNEGMFLSFVRVAGRRGLVYAVRAYLAISKVALSSCFCFALPLCLRRASPIFAVWCPAKSKPSYPKTISLRFRQRHKLIWEPSRGRDRTPEQRPLSPADPWSASSRWLCWRRWIRVRGWRTFVRQRQKVGGSIHWTGADRLPIIRSVVPVR